MSARIYIYIYTTPIEVEDYLDIVAATDSCSHSTNGGNAPCLQSLPPRGALRFGMAVENVVTSASGRTCPYVHAAETAALGVSEVACTCAQGAGSMQDQLMS